MLVIAIDPGTSGGIAWDLGEPSSSCVIPMLETRAQTIQMLRTLTAMNKQSQVAYCEKITGFIPDGGASQMFQFGAMVERCACILETLGVRIVEVPPQKWQQALGLGKSERVVCRKDMDASQKAMVRKFNADAKRKWKLKLRDEAARLFPHLKVTLKTADALLLLAFAIQEESK